MSRYPARLRPGWLADLQSFAGDLDVALHITPNAGAVVMAFLDRRIAELSSTVRVAEPARRPRRPLPARRAAGRTGTPGPDRTRVGAALRCQPAADALGRQPDELDAQTRRMEALLGARLVHTRRLLFQMRAGLISSMPLGLEEVPVRRVLSTTALSATFPFTGSDLPAGSGLLYGINTATRSLVLDRIWMGLPGSVVPTLVIVDEAWWLMRHADTAAFLFRLVKTARKRRAGLTLVTQDVGDVLSSPDGDAVVANAALQILMKQAPQAMPRLAEMFRLTRAEQSWLLGAQRGEGLLVAQGRRVPFQVVATDEELRLIEEQSVTR